MSGPTRGLWLRNAILLALLLLGSNRAVYSHLGPRLTAEFDRLRSDTLVKEKSRSELATYYEELLFRGDDIKYHLNQRYAGFRHSFQGTDPFDGEDSTHWHPVDDLRHFVPNPLQDVELDGVVHHFNSLGLRDREYSTEKLPGSYRIIMMGASNLMARGTREGAGFEPVLERMLNEGLPVERRVEIFNFGYDGYTEVKQLVQIDAGLVFPLDPDLVVFITHSIHDFWEPAFLERVGRSAYDEIGYARLVRLAKRLRAERGGIRTGLTDAERDSIVVWVYGELAKRCKEARVHCLAVGVPLPHSIEDPARLEERLDLIRRTGFPTLSLADSLRPYDIVTLQRASWDAIHLNERGHRIIAEDLHDALLEENRAAELGLLSVVGEARGD